MSRLTDLLGGMLRSNTMQFNTAAAVVWFLTVLMESDFVSSNPEYTAIAAGVMAIVNMVLRMKTKKPLEER